MVNMMPLFGQEYEMPGWISGINLSYCIRMRHAECWMPSRVRSSMRQP